MINTKTNSTRPELIAPCGIDCRLCRAFTRDKKACPGCRSDAPWKANACITCRIKNCEKRINGKFEYCFECDEFPCARMIHLDKRYRTKYETSPIDNLASIQKNGINNFIGNENIKWACPECGAMMCMHKPQCLACGYVWRK
jgi:hypothetical protein